MKTIKDIEGLQEHTVSYYFTRKNENKIRYSTKNNNIVKEYNKTIYQSSKGKYIVHDNKRLYLDSMPMRNYV